ncbi:MAG: hypothetical protein U0936_17335 [Planctomycetaceae bacterium]
MKSINQCVKEVSLQPAVLRLRLELADTLQNRRQSNLANWMRLWLARHEALAPLATTIPATAVLSRVQSSSYVCLNSTTPENHLEAWAAVCPNYWRTPTQCIPTNYFGRWIISCWAVNFPGNREQIDELATMDWLEKLWCDGLLEVIEFHLGRPETAEWFLALPERIRNLPVSVNTARAAGPGFGVDLSRRLLTMPSLIGLYLTLGTFPKSIVTELSSVAAKLQFLTVEYDRNTKEFDRLLHELLHLPKLRYLSLLGPKLSASNIDSLHNSCGISAMGVQAPHLDRDSLLAIGTVPGLKWLGINSSRINRKDVDDFRSLFPNTVLLLSSEIQDRIGPA